MNKQGKIALISILAIVLGAISSAVIWVVLKIMTLGMDLLWTILPAKLGAEHNLVYMMAVTIHWTLAEKIRFAAGGTATGYGACEKGRLLSI